MPEGRRLIDFRLTTLHVVSYSTPVRAALTRAELEPHLHSLPEQPDRIPYRTSYYREQLGLLPAPQPTASAWARALSRSASTARWHPAT
jgi:aminopeptidase-like protein